MHPYLILALLGAGAVGWFIPLYVFGILFIIALLMFWNINDEIGKFFMAAIAAVIIIGGTAGSGLQFYLNEYDESMSEPQTNYVIRNGVEYELKYIKVDKNDTEPKVIQYNRTDGKPVEKSFWENVKTYKPFEEN